ncbi:phage major capsid protein [endosymbiont 'TC1' of Trimyema compressum]|uniref:phage major capsid protein n=1 Tax=endosymbiont 'TC1' of Trimyema compressum TaxID=243899 RepID=UPI001392296D|nr:phage major capsid protein [endosymbiont 'TC1' of Trimyema compressum]
MNQKRKAEIEQLKAIRESGNIEDSNDVESLMESIEKKEAEIEKIKKNMENELKNKTTKEGKEKKMTDLLQEFRKGNLNMDFLSKTEIQTLEKDLFINSFRSIATGDRKPFEEYREFRATNLNEGNVGKNKGSLVVPTIIYDQIITKILNTSVILPRVGISYVPGNIDLIYDNSDIVVQWAGDHEGPRTLSETPIFSKKTLKPKLATVRVEISKLLLQVSMFNLENYIIEKVSSSLALAFDNMIINGTGETQPKGIVPALSNSKINIEFNYKNIATTLRSTLTAPYAQKSVLYFNRKTLGELDTISDKNDRPIFQIIGYGDSFNGQVLGVPVIISDIIPDNTMIYGDLQTAYYFNIAVEMDITNYDTAVLGGYNQGYLFATAADGDVIDTNGVALIEFKKK